MRKIGKIWNYAQVKLMIVVIVIIFPINAIMIVQSRQASETLISQAKTNYQYILDNRMNDLCDKMDNASEQLFQFIFNDSDLIRMMRETEQNYNYQRSKMKFYYTLQMIGKMSFGIDGYFYNMNNLDDLLVYSSDGTAVRKEMEVQIPEIIEHASDNGWRLYEINGKEYLLLLIKKSSVTFGGWVNLEREIRQLERKLNYNDITAFFSEGLPQADPTSELLISSKIKSVYLNLQIPLDEILKSLSGSHRIMQGMVLISFLLIPLLYFMIRRIYVVPLKVIIEAHACLQQDPDYRIQKTNHTIEFQKIYDSFNQMAARLKELKIEGYEKELAKRKMELRNIQIQMQPHFLLNTFNLVSNLSSRNEGKAIQEVVIYLSNYFRYIFRNNKELDLFFKELKMIEEYIHVMLIRYPDKIQFSSAIDPELSFVRVPPLLVHNFVENSIKHGLREDRILHITINGEWDSEENCVTLEIIDDGNGMTEEVLQQEQKKISGEYEAENPNLHSGFVNSLTRLKYYYGDEAKLDLYSEYESMTVVTIQFPYSMGAENDAFDCE